MDSLEVNKVIAAALVAGIAFSVSGIIGQSLVHVERLKESAIQIAVPKTADPKAQPEALPPIGQMMASADPAAGESTAKKVCAACHSFNEGGKAGVGPNLYGVVGASHAGKEGFAYSNALKGKQGPWTFAELNEWLYKPAVYAPGTRMGFAGLSNSKERASVIDYLRSLSPSPQPRPEPEQAAAGGSPAAGLVGTPGPATPSAPVPGAAGTPRGDVPAAAAGGTPAGAAGGAPSSAGRPTSAP